MPLFGFTPEKQGCQIFIGTTYQTGKNIPNSHKNTKWPQTNSRTYNRPNGHMIYQPLPLQDPPKFTQILGLKICHLATLRESYFHSSHYICM
jgi:hypothetical protein